MANLGSIASHPALDGFSPAVRDWFASSYPSPTPPQVEGWPSIAGGDHTLICAPTGSGKTLTAFLSSIDHLVTTPPVDDRTRRTRVIYISPLRALAVDVDKNLRSPLIGIGHAAERLGIPVTMPKVAMRTGDTSANERSKLIRNPPDLLITTPESLYLMLTSQAAETLRGVETVIVDEIHAFAATKRGAHLSLSLERLEELTDRPPQRIGLSATQRPLSDTARFLGGYAAPGQPRPVTIIDAAGSKAIEVSVIVPVEDMSSPGDPSVPYGVDEGGEKRTSIWPSITPRILDQILDHRSTIIFCNARRAAERLAQQLNDLALERTLDSDLDDHPSDNPDQLPGELVRAHHGSLARDQRVMIEDQLKSGHLRAIVATSSLELGIDMGAVDLVIQIESPGSVSRGVQRIGRAGHRVDTISRGVIFPKHRGDLIETAVVARRMLDGEIEHSTYLRNPLDVLAQQIVAHVAATDPPDGLSLDSLAALIRRSASFVDLSDDQLHNVIDLISGLYPSDEFAELRPRVVWDRIDNTLRPRAGAKRLAVTNGGTIPDRGLFGVFLPDGTRVGELDEEMVYESRAGEVFVLGASAWRIEDITFERVTVTPAPGVPGKMPFWRGDRPGRPLELGRAVGQFVREIRARSDDGAVDVLENHYSLDPLAARNVVSYFADQADATGVVPDDQTIVIERFRDEIGDWRICILSPFGTPVHAPWAMAIESRLVDRYGLPIDTMWGDDGIVIRIPEAIDELDPDDLIFDPDAVRDLVVAYLPQTSLFSARFREAAGRALLLPRWKPGKRTPLWQQRKKAADLLAVAAKYPSFPLLLETSRECLNDVFDVPALAEILGQIRSRAIRVVSVTTAVASPFASSLMFNWIANYLYDGDTPLAERRAAALAVDRDLLRDLLGTEELRDLLDAGVIADLELNVQRLADGWQARSADELHDVLRLVGDLSRDEIAVRCDGPGGDWLDELIAERRAIAVTVAGDERYIVASDAARYRDGLGCAIPVGLPHAFTEPVERPLVDLVSRFARTHGPFVPAEVADRLGITTDRVESALEALVADDRVVIGEFRPGGRGQEWCDAEILRQIRRRSLAALRREVEPVDQVVLGRFLPQWHGMRTPRAGVDALVDAIGLVSGAPLVASTLDDDLLGLRVANYRPADLDALMTDGEVVWVGAGSIGARNGRIRLCFADQVAQLAPSWDWPERPDGEIHSAIRTYLSEHGASLWSQLRHAYRPATDDELLVALWDLVWAGEVTNDSLTPLRAVIAHGAVAPRRRRRGRARHPRLTRLGPPAGAGRWSLVSSLLTTQPSSTEVAHTLAQQLLDRWGVVTRESVLNEGIRGGYASVYGVLKMLEERGQARRGYFVDGLGAAQFALPGALDRLRSIRDDDTPIMVLASTDPAQPYGATLAWPDTEGRPARTATSLVILDDGRCVAWFDRSSHHLITFNDELAPVATALADLVHTGRQRVIEVRKLNGGPVTDEVRDALLAAGFVDSYRGPTLRASSGQPISAYPTP